MEFTNTFTVPVGIDEAFATLTDLEKVAPCMPGAKLETVDGDVYEGRVKIKVGPMSLTYRGKAEMVEKDDDAHTARIEARGSEARGDGTASADVSAALTEVEDGTEVVVTTAIDITGKPAQFGRGVMGDVGAKILDRFADCLARKFDGPGFGGAESDARSHLSPLRAPEALARPAPTHGAPQDPAPTREKNDEASPRGRTSDDNHSVSDEVARLTNELERLTEENTRLTRENVRLLQQHTNLIRENTDLRTRLTDQP